MSGAADQILRWLLDASATTCALLGVVCLCLLLVKRPVWRRKVATAGLAGSVLLALFHMTPWMERFSLGWYDMQQPRTLPWLDDMAGGAWKQRASVSAAHPEASARPLAPASAWPKAVWQAVHEHAPRGAIVAYLLLGGAIGVRTLLGWMWLRHLRGQSRPAPERVRTILGELAEKGPLPEVRVSAGVDRPMIFGWRRPIILLPASLVRDVAGEDLRAVLAHELAHLRGGDLLRTWVVVPCVVLYYPLPPLWFVLRCLRLSQEQVADQAATNVMESPLAYADLLLKLAKRRARGDSALAMGAWRSPSETLLRVQSLLCWPLRAESAKARRVATAAAAGLLMLSAPLGMLTLADTSEAARTRAAELRGVRYLLGKQESSGGWLTMYGPAPTALAARSLLQAGVPLDHPAIHHAREYLNGCQQADGGFYTSANPAYQTAVVLSFYAAMPDVDAKVRLARGQAFLKGLAKPAAAPGSWYGGGRPNNEPMVDVQGGAERAQEAILETYGRLSYANWKSLAYAQLAPSDPRVVMATRWLKDHWTVERHPGTNGPEGHFYFLMAASRTLQATDAASGGQRTAQWRRQVQEWLLSAQDRDGSWINHQSPQWLENQPELVTAYALLALQAAR